MSRLVPHLSRHRHTAWRSLRARPVAVGVLAAHLVLGALYSIAVPMWEASDETGHFAFVTYLATERRFPSQGQDLTEWYDESHQPPLYYMLAAVASSWIDTSDWLEPEINPYAFTGKGMGGVNIAVHSDREALPYRGTALAIHVARLVSVLISTGVVAVTYLIGRLLVPQDEAIATGAMALNAFWPQFLFLGAVVTNDILVPLFSALAILFLLRIAYRPGNWPDFLGLALCLVGALATKMSAWGLVPLAGVVLILVAIRKIPASRRWWSLPLISWVFAVIWWGIRHVSVPDAWFQRMTRGNDMRNALSMIQHPLTEAGRARWDALPDALKYCSRTIWASFGWDNIGVEEWVYQVFILLCVAGAVGLGVFMARRTETVGRFGIVVVMLGVLFASAPAITITVTRNPDFLRGRIVSGAFPLLSVLLFLGMARLVTQSCTSLLSMALGTGLFALALMIPFRYIAPAYARPPILSQADIEHVQHPLEVNFDNKVQLLGYDIEPEHVRLREAIVVTLYWRALNEMEEEYTVGVHLVGPGYESYGGRDSYPARGNYATSLWNEGDMIRDIYWLPVPRDFPTPSAGRVEVTLYVHSTGQRLPVLNPQGEMEGDSVLLSGFGVVAREEPRYSIQYPLDHTLGGMVRLLGYDVPDRTLGALPLTLYWQGLAEMEEDYTVFVHVLDEEGNLLGQDDRQPCNGRYPTSVWEEGRIIEDKHYVDVAGGLPPGPHLLRIVVGMYLLETMQRLPVLDADGTAARHDEIVILHDLRVVDGARLYIPLILTGEASGQQS